ncbi:cell wall-binding repeat-containing protein [Kineococcus sp. LSe6-4]|uniref:Cell wall-binding repeat-containing protein n=1 Tax=Kineococcus halophytocola TaxID=3234027 RepID=A0ABV4H4S9_9ACTN
MTSAPRRPGSRFRRPATWLLAMSLPVGIVAGGVSAHAAPAGYAYAVADLVTSGAVARATGVAVAADGTVVFSDAGDGTVKTIDASGAATVVDATAGKLSHPAGLAFGPDGSLYIADPGLDRVLKLSGSTLSPVAGSGTEGPAAVGRPAVDSPLKDPTGVAVDAAGNVFIADAGNNQVEKVTAGSGTISVVAGTGFAGAAIAGDANKVPLNAPAAVALDAVGNLYVADSGNRTVGKVTADGRLAVLGSLGAGGRTPTSLAVDRNGTVYAADPVAKSIRTISPAGVVGTLSTGGGTFDVPTAVATDASGSLWVADDGVTPQVKVLTSTADPAAPRFTSAPVATGAVKQLWTYAAKASGTPAPTWSLLSDAPSWLTVASGTGVLSGTPTAAGNVTFTLRATNASGHDDQVITLTVGALPAAPAAPTAVAGDGRAVVTWKPATSVAATAGATPSPVTGYVVTPVQDGVPGTPVTFAATQATTQVLTGLANGSKYTFTVAAKNSFGTGTDSPASAAVTPYATVRKPVLDVPRSRLSGKDRIETSVGSSKALFPTPASAGSVVVSASTKYADALAGARLASAAAAPLLLTESDKLTATTGTEISRVLAPGGTIYVLGGSGTVSTAVENALTALSPNFTVKRIAGEDRYETAARIAEEVAARAPGTDTAPIYLASGVNFPDGLAVSALAARTGGVVLLTDGATLPAATKAALQAKDPGATRVVPVGGAAAAAATALPADGGSAARAIVGVDRFDTAALVAGRFTAAAGGTKVVGVATGDNWPDALVGSAAVGLLGGPLLLTSGPDLAPAARSALAGLNAAKPLTTGVVFGGEPSVPAAAYASLGRAIAQD